MTYACFSAKQSVTLASLEGFNLTYKELTEQQVADVEKLIERLEEDDDVQNVYHNMG